ncbi:MAG: hypothetical protein H6R40_277, partial [Gemmatimonadetes bacterium]|nr:hypothetical protein [Gemmatimonadota bacterium]
MTEIIRQALDASGIATWTIDVPGRSMNVFTAEFFPRLASLIESAATD